jgi:hypothetical protein
MIRIRNSDFTKKSRDENKVMDLISKLNHKDTHYKFSLHFLENMRDHSERYLRNRVSHFYDKCSKHNYNDKDVNYLRFINQSHYGMIVHDYFPSRPAKKRDYGQRGMLKLIVDGSVGEEFYKALLQKKYYVIKVKVHLMMNRESNFDKEEIELEWKKPDSCDNDGNGDCCDKIPVKSVWYNVDDNPIEEEPSIEMFENTMMKYYHLEDLRMYTAAHKFYHFTIVDNQETSSDFLVRLYDLIVKQYGRFEHKTFKDECDCIYLNAYIPVYAKENEMEIDEVDTNGFFCSNALKKGDC